MKCVVIKEPHNVCLAEKELAPLKKGFARIKVKAAAICATDLEVIDGNIPAKYPLTPGHEWSGVVSEVSDERYNGWLGKRVTGTNDVICGTCEACRRGEWRYCPEFEEIGFKRDGAYAEYVDVPQDGLVLLPDELSFEEAALAEPLGVAFGVWQKAKAKVGRTCLIYGAGSIGLCCLAVAKAMGLSKITVVATSSRRLETAKKLGADFTVATREEDIFEKMSEIHPGGTDYIIDATGNEECISNSLKLAKRGGTVVLAGYGGGKNMNIRIDDIHVKNLKLIGAGNNWNQHQKAVNFMAEKKVDMSIMVSEILSLEDFEKGIQMVRERPTGFVKAIFKFD